MSPCCSTLYIKQLWLAFGNKLLAHINHYLSAQNKDGGGTSRRLKIRKLPNSPAPNQLEWKGLLTPVWPREELSEAGEVLDKGGWQQLEPELLLPHPQPPPGEGKPPDLQPKPQQPGESHWQLKSSVWQASFVVVCACLLAFIYSWMISCGCLLFSLLPCSTFMSRTNTIRVCQSG